MKSVSFSMPIICECSREHHGRRKNPPASWSVEHVRLLSLQQPASSNPPAAASQPSQLASLASQSSQPGQPATAASGHRSLRPPGLDVSKLFYRGIQPVVLCCNPLAQAATGRHKPPQGGTGRHRPANFLAPTAPGGAAKHATNPSNIDDIATFLTNRVMGRL